MDKAFKNSIPDTWWNSKQTAQYLKISVGQLMNMCSDKKIIYYKLGRSNRYKKEDLDRFLLNSKQGTVNKSLKE